MAFLLLVAAGGCSEGQGPPSDGGVDAAPMQPDAARGPGLPWEFSLGLVAYPDFTSQGAWELEGAELAPDAVWSANPGMVHLLGTGASVGQTVALPVDTQVGIKLIWRGTGASVLRGPQHDVELPESPVWTYSTRCVGILSEPMSIELSVEQTTPGVVEIDHLDVIDARGCWGPYP